MTSQSIGIRRWGDGADLANGWRRSKHSVSNEVALRYVGVEAHVDGWFIENRWRAIRPLGTQHEADTTADHERFVKDFRSRMHSPIRVCPNGTFHDAGDLGPGP